jgi:hypothetical protein
MKHIEEIKNSFERFNRNLEEIEPSMYKWVLRSPSVSGDIAELKKRENDPGDKYPESWHDMMASSRAISYTLTRKELIQKFLNSHRHKITDDAIEMLKQLMDNPMRWTAFRVDEKLDKNLFRITDVLDKEKLLPPLYSRGVSDLVRSSTSEDNLYITLLSDNGYSLQATGLIHRYLSVTEDDLHFLCTVLDKDLYENRGLSGVINKHFLNFFVLDEIAEIPPIMFRGMPSRIIWRELHLEDIGRVLLPGTWDIEETTEGVLRFEFLGPDEKLTALEPMAWQDPEKPWEMSGLFPSYLYLYPSENTACIHASSLQDYAILHQVLSCRFNLDKNLQKNLQKSMEKGARSLPFFRISSQVWTMVSQIPDIVLPWDWYTEQFEEDEREDEEEDEKSEFSKDSPLMASLNTLISEVMVANNSDTEVDIPKRCEELGLDLSTAESILEQLEGMTKKMMPDLELTDDDRAWEIPNLTVPPPSIRREFSKPLYDSTLFRTTETPHCYELFASLAGEKNAAKTEPGDMEEYITSLFEDAFDRMGLTIMNSLFYMLVEQGDRWTSVRSFGIEILKLFYQVLLPALKVDRETFLSQFSRFVLMSLCSNGLLELSERPKGEARTRGTYRIRPSVFFRCFIAFNP